MAFTPNWIDQVTGFPWSNAFNRHVTANIGSTLYTVARDGVVADPPNPLMYKSGNAGASWSSTFADGPDLYGRTSGNAMDLFANNGQLYAVLSNVFRTDNIQLAPYDPTNDTWGSIDDTGIKWDRISDFTYPLAVARYRPDGSLILAYQRYADFWSSVVSVKKRVGGVWSTITEFGTVAVGPDGDGQDVYQLQDMLLDANGNAHLLMGKGTNDPGNGTPTWDLVHASISAASDAVSSVHVLESNIETGYNFLNANFGPGDVNASKIGWGYGYQIETNFPTGGELHCVIGDLTVDPLNPTWTVETVSSSIFPGARRDYTLIQLAFVGSAPQVFFLTPYPDVSGANENTAPYSLWSSTRGASSWPAPTKFFDAIPPVGTDYPYPSKYSIGDFDLLNAFGSTGLGVLVDVSQHSYAVTPYHYGIGYQGPSVAPASYAYARTRGCRAISLSGRAIV